MVPRHTTFVGPVISNLPTLSVHLWNIINTINPKKQWKNHLILAMVPVVGLVCMIVWACGVGNNPHLARFARGMLLALSLIHISTVILVAVPRSMMMAGRGYFSAAPTAVQARSAPREAGSVSYTHLDVYKRQGWGLPFPFRCTQRMMKPEIPSCRSTGSIISVSYTHLQATDLKVFAYSPPPVPLL